MKIQLKPKSTTPSEEEAEADQDKPESKVKAAAAATATITEGEEVEVDCNYSKFFFSKGHVWFYQFENGTSQIVDKGLIPIYLKQCQG